MSANTVDPLEKVIREAGEAWMLDGFSAPDQALTQLKNDLEKLNTHARKYSKGDAPNFTAEGLENERQLHPQQVGAFLQALGATRSPEMLLMVWRIIHGMDIEGIEMHYSIEKSFSLTVSLISPDSGISESYHSEDIDDAALLRHLGIMKMDGRPIFDGFYPLQVS